MIIKKLNIISLMLLTSLIFAQDHPQLTGLQVSYGKLYRGISLRWSPVTGATGYEVYRSDRKNGRVSRITSVADTVFLDNSCEPGVEYFYKVAPVFGSRRGKFSREKSGYRLIDVSNLYTLNSIIDKKNRKVAIQSAIVKRRLELIDEEYIGWLKIKFILFVSKPYFLNSKVIVLTDFDQFSTRNDQNTIHFHPDNENYALSFYGQRPFNLLKRTNDTELFNRLLRNSIAFCVYQGDVKIRDSKGRNKFIPQYEAIGLATQYYKYADNWASRTILFSSERDEIMQQVRKIEEESRD
jgi:hypothetical protein